MRGDLRLFAAVVASWLVFTVGVILEIAPLRVIGGLMVALVLPGVLAARALGIRSGGVERVVAVTCLALAIAIGLTLAAGVTTSTSTGSMIVWIAALTEVLVALTWRRVRPVVAVPGQRRRPAPTRLAVLGVSAAVSLAMLAGAAWLTLGSADAAADPRTVVTLVEAAPSATPRRGSWSGTASHELSIVNREGRKTSYDVEIIRADRPPTTERVRLADGETWTAEVQTRQPGDVTIRVWGGTPASATGYREVRTASR